MTARDRCWIPGCPCDGRATFTAGLQHAWAESPVRVVAAIALTPFFVLGLWFLMVVYLVAGTPA